MINDRDKLKQQYEKINKLEEMEKLLAYHPVNRAGEVKLELNPTKISLEGELINKWIRNVLFIESEKIKIDLGLEDRTSKEELMANYTTVINRLEKAIEYCKGKENFDFLDTYSELVRSLYVTLNVLDAYDSEEERSVPW